MARKNLNRRTFLRGAFGASMALPLLELMLENPRLARAQAASAPKRYFVAFGGFSLGADGDPKHDDYVPDTEGPGYDASTKSAIAPFALDDLSREISIVSGLRVPREGPGRYDKGRYHGGNHSPLLSGVPSFGDDAGAANILGATSDQVVADAIAGQTLFPSLRYCVQPKIYSGGPYNGWIISTRKREDGTLERLEPTVSPRQAYESLFYNFRDPEDAAAQQQFELERNMRISVLDACQASRERLAAVVGRSDYMVLEQYFDHCRDLERRLQALPPASTDVCMKPTDPGEDPAEGDDTFSSMQNAGSVPEGTGWSNETLRARVFCDLIHMAFACDLSRVATLVLTRNQCFMSAREITGYGVDLHSLGHRIGGSPSTTIAVSKGIAWHMGHFAYLVKKLRDTRDGSGQSLLDTSALVFLNEGGHGPNPEEAAQFGAQDLIDNGSSHSMENMACAIAGGASGLKRGHHVRALGKHPVNVLLTLMNAVGAEANELGEVTGVIPELFA
jgi:hypothetical protein